MARFSRCSNEFTLLNCGPLQFELLFLLRVFLYLVITISNLTESWIDPVTMKRPHNVCIHYDTEGKRYFHLMKMHHNKTHGEVTPASPIYTNFHFSHREKVSKSGHFLCKRAWDVLSVVNRWCPHFTLHSFLPAPSSSHGGGGGGSFSWSRLPEPASENSSKFLNVCRMFLLLRLVCVSLRHK